MGFFRSARSTTSSSNVTAPGLGGDGSVVALLRAKISQLEEQVANKDSLIGDLQIGLEGNLKCLNNLDMSSSTLVTACTASTTSSGSGSGSLRHSSSVFEENLMVSRLTVQLEDKNTELASLQVQLEEQRQLTTHLQERLQLSDQGKATLVKHVDALESQLFDKGNQIECLQALNETNATIVSEMELVQSHKDKTSHCHTHNSNNNTPNQWKMYQQLQSLMETNNKMALQLATVTQEKQQALKQATKLQKDQLNLCDQIDALTKELEQKEHKLTQIQLEVNMIHSTSSTSTETQGSTPALQPAYHHTTGNVLDALPCNTGSNDSDDTAHSEEDAKLLKLSLQVCQSHLKQIQKEHELQVQKSVCQSVQLAESRAKVDTLSAKLEHYENLLDNYIKNAPSLEGGGSSPQTSSHGSTTSKAARQFMMNEQDQARVPVVSPTGANSTGSNGLDFAPESYKSPSSSYTLNALKRLSLPKFIRSKSPVKEESRGVNGSPSVNSNVVGIKPRNDNGTGTVRTQALVVEHDC